MFIYEDYLKEENHLSFEKAVKIHAEILKAGNLNDIDFKELWEEVLESAIVYGHTRALWSIQSFEQRREIDETRTRQHNLFMSNLKVLMRYMEGQGWHTEWFVKIGTIESDRKRLGDFACYLVNLQSLLAR